MKSVTLTILISIFNITTIYSQTSNYERKIKSIKVKECNYVDRFGNYEKENCVIISAIHYDSDGNRIEWSWYKGQIAIPVYFTEYIIEYYD